MDDLARKVAAKLEYRNINGDSVEQLEEGLSDCRYDQNYITFGISLRQYVIPGRTLARGTSSVLKILSDGSSELPRRAIGHRARFEQCSDSSA